jgi:hypothetical protein
MVNQRTNPTYRFVANGGLALLVGGIKFSPMDKLLRLGGGCQLKANKSMSNNNHVRVNAINKANAPSPEEDG